MKSEYMDQPSKIAKQNTPDESTIDNNNNTLIQRDSTVNITSPQMSSVRNNPLLENITLNNSNTSINNTVLQSSYLMSSKNVYNSQNFDFI